MAKSTKSFEERMLEMEKREQESLAKARRKRTHRLCQIGGAVESVLGVPIEEEDIPKLIGFLKKQEANGNYFSRALGKGSASASDSL